MKVAWLIGSVMSKEIIMDLSTNQKSSGGWVYTQIEFLNEMSQIEEIHVISINEMYENDGSFIEGKIHVYLIKDKPIRLCARKRTFQKIDDYLKENQIDILDVQGTETTISSFSAISTNRSSIPMLNTIHGVVYQIYRFYAVGLPKGFLFFHRSLKDWFTFHGVLEGKLLMKRRAHIENNTLLSISYVRGRTQWDRMSVLSVNPQIKYYHTELIMRPPFYLKRWDIDYAEPYRIFVPQMRIPYKGMFVLLEAIAIAKEFFPSITVHVPGEQIKKGIKGNGYEKYIWRLIKKLNLEKCIVFTGSLNSEEMVRELLEARVFVLPSIIENSPNSLTEAQMIGTPTVSSLVGGVADYIKNGETGLLYNCLDYVMCAECIVRLFNDRELSCSISQKAREIALMRHDPYHITDSLINCYQNIIDSFKKTPT